ncbi:MAG TPA: family 78 glycoside hydrolase catalytic domain [Vicinamibacteria bacterium]|nr:family 78 glycoside hydrolase catalytic domain [Vicinamibacteria bacterium]
MRDLRSFAPAAVRQASLAGLLGLLAAASPAATPAAPPPSVANLRCEYKVDPLGIDAAQPRLSWQLRSDARDVVQSAYEVQVTRDGKLLWDTGRVTSSRSVLVPYGGPALESSRRYSWRVRVWDGSGRASAWSAPASWEMGLLSPEDWKARWIEAEGSEDKKTSPPAPMLRGSFTLQGAVRSARAYATSLGLYELEINGKRVGDQLFTPGWTSYKKRLQYQTYDVTGLLRRGENVVGATLGDGWYRGFLAWSERRNVFGDRLALLCQLRIEHADGRVETVGTDGKWKSATGPIRLSDIYMGETYDARLERTGWSAPGYDDKDWVPVRVASPDKRALIAPAGPPVRRIEEIRPVKILKTPAGETVFDLGQNMVGHVRLKVRGSAGATVTLRHAEVLDKAGNLYTANLRAAKQQVIYVLKGGGDEVYEPHFTFQGFRYVAVAGWPGEPALDALTGVVVHSDMPVTGQLTTSNPLLNQLQHNIRWGQKGNFLDVPTDCPQRDERLGWTGDAQVFSRTAAFNMDVAGFFTKWLGDVAADQQADGAVPYVIPDVLSEGGKGASASAAWADVATIIPWNMYLAYGDTRLLERQYPSMKAWVEYMRRQAGDRNLWATGFHFGDWLAFASTASDYPGATTGKDLIATAFYAHSTDLLQRTAAVLGKKEDAAEYRALLPKIKEAFVREFVTDAGRVGENTQTAYAVALQFDLLPEGQRKEAARRLAAEVRARGHLTTGFVGTPYLCHVLSRFGYTDVAYRLLLREDYPSWLYPVKQGATTIWERWDGQKPDGSFQDAGMNSFNHYAYGAIGEWMVRVVAGLEIDEQQPGYEHVLVQPQPGGGLSSAEARLQTPYGEAASGWALADGQATVSATVPPNAHGTIRLPAATEAGVTEGGRALASAPGVKSVAQAGDDVVVEVGSGSYRFAYGGAALAARAHPPGRLSTRTPIQELLASPPARAALDKRLPGFTSDPRLEQAQKMSLREIAPFAPAVLTEGMLKNLDDDLRAIP